MKYTQIALVIATSFRTARPVVSMSLRSYVDGGGPFSAVFKPWTLGEQA